jgi:hypothetical protein
LEFPTKSGQGVNAHSDCSHSAVAIRAADKDARRSVTRVGVRPVILGGILRLGHGTHLLPHRMLATHHALGSDSTPGSSFQGKGPRRGARLTRAGLFVLLLADVLQVVRGEFDLLLADLGQVQRGAELYGRTDRHVLVGSYRTASENRPPSLRGPRTARPAPRR